MVRKEGEASVLAVKGVDFGASSYFIERSWEVGMKSGEREVIEDSFSSESSMVGC